MHKRFIGLPLAGLLLVGGATAVLAQSGAAPAVAGAATSLVNGAGSILDDVLADLVGDGTITQEQADAITDALETRRDELREEAEALREQMRTFLEDGTLSADELAQLPEDHPLRNLDQFLDDGQLTEDELQQLRGFGLHGPGFHIRPFHGGPGWFGDRDGRAPVDPDSSALPDGSDDGEASDAPTS